MADTELNIAQRQLAHGNKYPYDGGDVAAPAIDWAHAAARGLLADLLDRRGVKWELEKVAPDVRADIVTALAAIVRAAAPSPSTAPEVMPLPDKPRSAYTHLQRGALYDSIAMDAYAIAYASKVAALASRPAEVDNEGLPPLPEPEELFEDSRDEYGYLTYGKAYTAEQYRQGQRDAVAADRARRAAAGGDQ